MRDPASAYLICVDHEADRAQQITGEPDDLIGVVETRDGGAGIAAVDRHRKAFHPLGD
jgi:hypothetical protein